MNKTGKEVWVEKNALLTGSQKVDKLETLEEIIKKHDDEYCVMSHKGKNLGCSPTKAGAHKRLGQVEYFKSHETNEDLIPGGKGDKTDPKTLDQKQLSMGIKVEMEHTKDAKKAREIATDHLTENPRYYSKLKKSGLADELDENVEEDVLLKKEKHPKYDEKKKCSAERELDADGILDPKKAEKGLEGSVPFQKKGLKEMSGMAGGAVAGASGASPFGKKIKIREIAISSNSINVVPTKEKEKKTELPFAQYGNTNKDE